MLIQKIHYLSFLQFWIISSPGRIFLIGSFFFRHFEYFMSFPFGLQSFCWNSAHSLMRIPLYVTSCFSLAAINILYLSLTFDILVTMFLIYYNAIYIYIYMYIYDAYMLSDFSGVWFCGTLWTAACQAPLSMGFSRHKYWSGLPCLPQGDLPDPGVTPASLMSGRFFAFSTQGKPIYTYIHALYVYIFI